MATSGVGDDEVGAADLAVRLRLVVGRLSRRIRVDAGATLPSLQLCTLVTVDRYGPQRLSELAVREDVAKSTMSRVLAAMDRRGLIVRASAPDDGRGLLVSITPAGTALLGQVCGHPTALVARRIDRLGPAHRAALRAALPALEALLADDGRSTG